MKRGKTGYYEPGIESMSFYIEMCKILREAQRSASGRRPRKVGSGRARVESSRVEEKRRDAHTLLFLFYEERFFISSGLRALKEVGRRIST